MAKRTQDQRLWIDLSLNLLSQVELDSNGDMPNGALSLFKETRLALFPAEAKQPKAPQQPTQPKAAPLDPIKELLRN